MFSVSFSARWQNGCAAGQDGQIRLIDAATGKIAKEFVSVPLVKEKSPRRQRCHRDDTVRADVKRTTRSRRCTPAPPSPPSRSSLTNVKIAKPTEYAQLLVTATMSDGTRADVTRMAKITAANERACIDIDSRGMMRPDKDGGSSHEDQPSWASTASVPVTVSGMNVALKPDYVRDIMPITSKLGCNARHLPRREGWQGGLQAQRCVVTIRSTTCSPSRTNSPAAVRTSPRRSIPSCC
jgi:hypothetical protein